MVVQICKYNIRFLGVLNGKHIQSDKLVRRR